MPLTSDRGFATLTLVVGQRGCRTSDPRAPGPTLGNLQPKSETLGLKLLRAEGDENEEENEEERKKGEVAVREAPK